ncbi:MAG: DUF1579 domain-containing protein [Planctomycetaceae bacterium]|nr:DUF1579 domain-containing protein [Planctomycetaceae bacterium]
MTRKFSFHTFSLVIAIVLTAGFSVAQQPGPPPELDELKKLVGTWDTITKVPGQPDSTGVARYRLGVGGMWVISDMEGKIAGLPYQGHGLDSYDTGKKKYVSVWVDSMSGSPNIFEGNYEGDKGLVMTGETTSPEGQLIKWRSISQMPDDDHIKFDLFMVTPDGKENLMISINYTRRKK